MVRIDAKVTEQLIDSGDAASIKAVLACRIKIRFLNFSHADEETPCTVVKEQLKKASKNICGRTMDTRRGHLTDV